MIVGRAPQGLASGVVPLGIGIMRDELPAERLGTDAALLSACLGVGGALGLPAAVLVADRFDRHTLFWTSAALGAVAGLLVLLLVPEFTVRTSGRSDLPGALGMAAGLIRLLPAVSKGADWGWRSGMTRGLFAAAVVPTGLLTMATAPVSALVSRAWGPRGTLMCAPSSSPSDTGSTSC
ncbi:MFS transporter [Streptomyces sp. MMG1121]|uniref:MFS transporter n=1 Tax=Streptomyces sp. MMG1121 TaxID=1415544 RepID=UPI000AB85B44